ncbi:glucosaminidase domain-containing protein [Paenibacillaceae bacterium WGS1546]|uniref:glucosaminidase domain-containing protein n=1 Tax=Cohnella sp. WGS1546 TaxID=3366810 RepID=UPI00372CEDC8
MRGNFIRKWLIGLAGAAMIVAIVDASSSAGGPESADFAGERSFAAHPSGWPAKPFETLAGGTIPEASPAESAPGEGSSIEASQIGSGPNGIPSGAAAGPAGNPDAADSAAIARGSETAPVIAKNENEVHISALPAPSRVVEVTAYYLNVRANGYTGSKIIDVVEKGTRLEIVSENEKGWLRVKGGGYVHGAYTEPAPANAGSNGAKESRLTVPGAFRLATAEPSATRGETAAREPESGQASDKAGSPLKPTSAVETESGLTEEDIALMFEGTALAGHDLESTILEVEEQYGINALFTIAVMKLESGNGSSNIAKKKNNLFGLNATGPDPHSKAFSFETKGDSVRKFGQLLADNYVDKGLTTIEKIARKYCPANAKWPSLVKNIMNRDFKKLNAT